AHRKISAEMTGGSERPPYPPVLADRLKTLAPSSTLAVQAKARELRARGIDVISFGAGEPDFDTPQRIKDAAVQAMRRGQTKYTEVGGILELRAAVCAKLKRDNGLDYTPADVLVSCGAKHTLFNLVTALLNPGDEMLVPSPFWVSYPEQARLLGAVPVAVPTREDGRPAPGHVEPLVDRPVGGGRGAVRPSGRGRQDGRRVRPPAPGDHRGAQRAARGVVRDAEGRLLRLRQRRRALRADVGAGRHAHDTARLARRDRLSARGGARGGGAGPRLRLGRPREALVRHERRAHPRGPEAHAGGDRHARLMKWGAPKWPPSLFKREGYAPSDSPASAR